MVLEIQWSTVRAATENLAAQRMLGKGSFAVVYFAELSRVRREQADPSTWEELQQHASSPVAIKVLIAEQNAKGITQKVIEYNQKAEAEELRLMSGYAHRNLCCLLGFSLDGPHKCYM
jgi:hypothetical protein